MGLIVRLYTVSTKRMPDSGLLAQREHIISMRKLTNQTGRKEGWLGYK
jgi:hypothetical protein